MQTWYVTHTVPALHGEEQGKRESLRGFPDKASAITFALSKLDEGLIVVAGTLEGVVPEEHLTCAEIKQLRNSI